MKLHQIFRRVRPWRAVASGIPAVILLAASVCHGQLVANSYYDFSGTQGQNGWYHGYYAASGDGDGYQDFDFQPFQPGVPGGAGDTNPRFGFNGAWDYFNGAGAAQNPPWTFLAAADVHPDSQNQPLGELWAIRRYVVQPGDVPASGGDIAVLWRMRKTNPFGAGVTGKVFVNGAELNSVAIEANDVVGIARSIHVPGVFPGDVVDLAYTPVGPSGDVFDGADGGQNLMKIRGNATAFTPYQATPVPVLPNFGGQVFANSATEFSGVQGQDNWYYGYYRADTDFDGYQDFDFTPFDPGAPSGAQPPRFGFSGHWDYLDAGGGRPNPPWTEVTASGGHPNGSNNAGAGGVHWAIRRWESETDGEVQITGTLATSAACGDGTTPTIMVNGVPIFSQNVFGNFGGYSVNATLNVGDVVDFVIDNGPSGQDPCDGTTFTAQIASAPPTLNVLANSQTDFSGVQGQNRWRYGYWDRRRDEDIAANGDGVYHPNEFVQFDPAQFNGAAWDIAPGVAPWTEVGAGGGHPAGQGQGNPEVQWAMRRWTSNVDGLIRIEGVLNNPGAGDGVVGRIFVDGYEVWSELSDGANVPYSIIVPVGYGSKIDFAIDSGFLDFDGADGATFTALITSPNTPIPEPSSIWLLTAGVSAACVGLRRARRRQRR